MTPHSLLTRQTRTHKQVIVADTQTAKPFIERMKNLDFPGIDVDVAGADTVSVIGWDQTGSGDFIAEELEAGLLDALYDTVPTILGYIRGFLRGSILFCVLFCVLSTEASILFRVKFNQYPDLTSSGIRRNAHLERNPSW